MAGDLYEGQGRRIDPAGGIVSEGAFSAGKLEGEGLERSSDGALLREGTFSGDLLNGPGREYGPGGVLLREGTFEDGLLNGEGTQYVQSGALQYHGEFRRGVWHGQGKLYDISLGALRYEGEFVEGVPVGLGRIYHPGGQLLYEGAVSEGRPRAIAFLGLSLAEVEAAFTEHWLLYCAQDGSAAFVYPYFQLMFWTDGPVRLTSPTRQEAEAERERQELLAALAAPAKAQGEAQPQQPPEAVQSEAPQPVQSAEPQPTQSAEPQPTQSAGPEATQSTALQAAQFASPQAVQAAEQQIDPPAEPFSLDLALAPDTDKRELTIRAVLCYGNTLAGAAQPGADASVSLEKTGWREQFSDFAAGAWAGTPPAVQAGPFVYEFPELSEEAVPAVECLLAQRGGVESSTAYRRDKEGSLWYQSAVRKEEP